MNKGIDINININNFDEYSKFINGIFELTKKEREIIKKILELSPNGLINTEIKKKVSSEMYIQNISQYMNLLKSKGVILKDKLHPVFLLYDKKPEYLKFNINYGNKKEGQV